MLLKNQLSSLFYQVSINNIHQFYTFVYVIFDFGFLIFAFYLEFVSLRKKDYILLFLLLNKCKLSYFIGYRFLNLIFNGVKFQKQSKKKKSDMHNHWKHVRYTKVEPPSPDQDPIKKLYGVGIPSRLELVSVNYICRWLKIWYTLNGLGFCT
jgi:hypothetical protein